MLEKLIYFAITTLIFYYFSTALQWYSYKLKRVMFHFSKPLWHVWYFLAPLGVIGVSGMMGAYIWAGLFLAFFAIALLKWSKGLDKKLVFTARVKRLWAIFAVILCSSIYVFHGEFQILSACFAIFGAHYISAILEREIIAKGFEKKAKEKLAQVNPIVVGITASFGKTSIKNFAAHILSKNFSVYATTASVNSKIGDRKDINDYL